MKKGFILGIFLLIAGIVGYNIYLMPDTKGQVAKGEAFAATKDGKKPLIVYFTYS